jgi:hypothetical protein
MPVSVHAMEDGRNQTQSCDAVNTRATRLFLLLEFLKWQPLIHVTAINCATTVYPHNNPLKDVQSCDSQL